MKLRDLVNLTLIIFITFITLMIFSCFYNNSKEIEASGTIEINETNVSSKNNDEVKELYVDEGDYVKEGEKLAEINHSILDLQLTLAKSNFDNAETNYIRIKRIYESENTSLKEKEDAENKYIVSQKTYEITKKQINDCYIKAPNDGIITNKFVEKGEFVNIGNPIYSIAQVDPVNLTIYVTEIELGKIKIGQEVKIKIDAYPKRFFTGKIIYISPTAEFTPKNIQTKEERVKQVFGVKIEIPNKEGILKPGIPADAIIENNKD
jgi:HlyD family secretion protein